MHDNGNRSRFSSRSSNRVSGEGGATAKIHKAARKGDDEQIGSLLDKGEDINAQERITGWTPLQLAAFNSHVSTVSLLLSRGAQVNAGAGSGGTALHGAGNCDCVRALLAAGADIQAPTKKGQAPLHTQAKDGRAECVEALLNAGADPDARGENGRTALHEAATFGQTDVVRLLLARGADVNATDAKGHSPLSMAAFAPGEGDRRALILQLLTTAGADRAHVGRIERQRLQSDDRRLAGQLIAAVQKADMPKVSELLDQGIDPSLDDGDSTPLHYALAQGCTTPDQLGIVSALLAHGADVNVRTRTGMSSYDRNKRWRTLEWAGTLASDYLLHGTGSPGTGLAPLDFAAMHDESQAAALLIGAGADMNAAGQDAETPLHLCALYGSVQTARVLVEAGADVNARTTQKQTPLGWALVRDDPMLRADYRAKVQSIVRLLREHGAVE